MHTFKRSTFFKRAFHCNVIASLHLSYVGDEYPTSPEVYIVMRIPCYFVHFYGRLVLVPMNQVSNTT